MLATTLRSARHLSASATTASNLVRFRPEHPDWRILTSVQGHESNSCPHPRTTETKQCYHCQGLGHVQADCPTLRLSGATSGRCYSCGQPGHLARNCTSAPAPGGAPPAPRGGRGGFGGFRGGYGGAGGVPRAATCYKCGGPNHYARDCQAQAMKCYACGKLGHISRDCTAPNGGPLNSEGGKTCYRCGEVGHISKNCPQAETNGVAPAAAAATAAEPVAAAAPAAPAAAPPATTPAAA
jgi:cellular nucleic acid-binding protein